MRIRPEMIMKPGHKSQSCGYTTSIQFHGTVTAFWTGLRKENLIEARNGEHLKLPSLRSQEELTVSSHESYL